MRPAGTSTSPGGPVVPGFQPAVDQLWDLQDQVPQSPVLLGGPLDVGSGETVPSFVRFPQILKFSGVGVTGNDKEGVGKVVGETNAHFPLPPSTQSTSKMSLGFERELGTKIGKALNLNEVCRIGIDDPLNFESRPRENWQLFVDIVGPWCKQWDRISPLGTAPN